MAGDMAPDWGLCITGDLPAAAATAACCSIAGEIPVGGMPEGSCDIWWSEFAGKKAGTYNDRLIIVGVVVLFGLGVSVSATWMHKSSRATLSVFENFPAFGVGQYMLMDIMQGSGGEGGLVSRRH